MHGIPLKTSLATENLIYDFAHAKLSRIEGNGSIDSQLANLSEHMGLTKLPWLKTERDRYLHLWQLEEDFTEKYVKENWSKHLPKDTEDQWFHPIEVAIRNYLLRE